jgi:hypothetical protein
MEISAYGETCLRLKGREGVVAADAFPAVVGPTGRGLTADIATYSHADDSPSLGLVKGGKKGAAARHNGRRGEGIRVPTSLEPAFLLDSPGEFEVHEILITGVRTFRDESRGAENGSNTCFVYELDGLHTIHLGDIGHLLNEEMLEEVGSVDVVCVPVGGTLSPSRTAELVAQLDAKLIVPMPLKANGAGAEALSRFLHEMSVQHSEPVPRLAVTMGVGTILESRRCILLAFGAHKAMAVKESVEGPVTAQVTASALQLHREVIGVFDEAAAHYLGVTPGISMQKFIDGLVSHYVFDEGRLVVAHGGSLPRRWQRGRRHRSGR